MKSLGLPLRLRRSLAATRRQRRLSQAELGKLVGLPQMHISAIENGRVVPRYDTILEIVRVLGHELMLVPRDVVPVVEALVQERNRKADGLEQEEEPLYRPDSDEDDNDLERQP
ncbi:MAG: helix-turn-helix transcriptional regulator [Acidobacteria bacterium]|nr:helix-turn-helix transcriptional regulator [Acidobacteriota bacterium]